MGKQNQNCFLGEILFLGHGGVLILHMITFMLEINPNSASEDTARSKSTILTKECGHSILARWNNPFLFQPPLKGCFGTLKLSSHVLLLVLYNQILRKNWSLEIVVRDFGFFLPSGFLSVFINIIFSNSDLLSGIAN